MKKHKPTICPLCKKRPVSHYPNALDDEDEQCYKCRQELQKDIKNRHCKYCVSTMGAINRDTHVTYKWQVIEIKTGKIIRDEEICGHCVSDVGVHESDGCED